MLIRQNYTSICCRNNSLLILPFRLLIHDIILYRSCILLTNYRFGKGMFQGIYKPPKSQLLKVATVSSSVSDEDVEESSFKLRLSWQD